MSNKYLELNIPDNFLFIELLLTYLKKFVFDKDFLRIFLKTLRIKLESRIRSINKEKYILVDKKEEMIYIKKYKEPIRPEFYEDELYQIVSCNRVIQMIDSVNMNDVRDMNNIILSKMIENYFEDVITLMSDNNNILRKVNLEIDYDNVGDFEPIFNDKLVFFSVSICHRIILMDTYLQKKINEMENRYISKFNEIGFYSYYNFKSMRYIIKESELNEKLFLLEFELRKHLTIDKEKDFDYEYMINNMISEVRKDMYNILYFNQSFFFICKKLYDPLSLKNYFNIESQYLDLENKREILFLVTLVDIEKYFLKYN
jgi:hypothetical protein